MIDKGGAPADRDVDVGHQGSLTFDFALRRSGQQFLAPLPGLSATLSAVTLLLETILSLFGHFQGTVPTVKFGSSFLIGCTRCPCSAIRHPHRRLGASVASASPTASSIENHKTWLSGLRRRHKNPSPHLPGAEYLASFLWSRRLSSSPTYPTYTRVPTLLLTGAVSVL